MLAQIYLKALITPRKLKFKQKWLKGLLHEDENAMFSH